jgi:hypothetical protein
MLRHPAFRLFVLALAVLLALAYFGPRFGLVGCEDLPEWAIGPCQVGHPQDR